MAKLSEKQRQLARDVALTGAAIAGAEKVYKVAKPIFKKVGEHFKKKINKRKYENNTYEEGK